MKKQAGKEIETAIAAENWIGARKLVRAQLRRSPNDHYLLGRLALTFYEQRKYERALDLDLKALQQAPYCPLLVWGHAGTLDMLGRLNEAMSLYRWLLSRGEEQLAHGECGEGILKARSLIADCHYRIACIWRKKRQWKRATVEFETYLSMRRKGFGSIYSLREVKVQYEKVRAKVRG